MARKGSARRGKASRGAKKASGRRQAKSKPVDLSGTWKVFRVNEPLRIAWVTGKQGGKDVRRSFSLDQVFDLHRSPIDLDRASRFPTDADVRVEFSDQGEVDQVLMDRSLLGDGDE